MKNHLLLLTLAVLGTGLFNPSLAQQSPKLAELVEKKLPKGKGLTFDPRHRLKAKKHPAPKRIGILTFSVGSDAQYNGNDGVWNHYKTMSAAGANAVAEALHQQSLPGLKEAFSSNGVELLSAQEYLNTDEKREHYNSLDLSAKGALQAGLSKAIKADQCKPAAGYRYFHNAVFMTDYKIKADLLEAMKKYDLDGFLIIHASFYGPQTLTNVHTSLILKKDPEYQPKAKKDNARRTEIAINAVTAGSTSLDAAEVPILRNAKKGKRDEMVGIEGGQLWVDRNVSKLISTCTYWYFPLIK